MIKEFLCARIKYFDDNAIFSSFSTYLSHIDANKAKYIETLTEAVAIKSVSAWPHCRHECQLMIDWAETKMKALAIETQQVDIGNQTLPDGNVLKLPNVVLGTLGSVSIYWVIT